MELDAVLRDNTDRVAQLQRDRAMVKRLDDAWQGQTELDLENKSPFDFRRGAQTYAEAFEKYGIPVLTGDAEARAAAIRSSGIRPFLVQALDDWARLEPEPDIQARLERLADRSRFEPDPLLVEWRHAAKTRQKDELLRLLPLREQRPLDGRAVVHIGRDLREMGCANAAIDALVKSNREHPQDFWINAELGYFYLRRGDADSANLAISYLRAALTLRPETAGIRLNLGMAALQLRNLDEALHQFESAIDLSPNDAAAHADLGAILQMKGNLPEAEREDREAIRLAPKAYRARMNLAGLLRKQGRTAEAESEYRAAIPLAATDPVARRAIAAFLLQNATDLVSRRKLREAQRDLEDVLRLIPGDPESIDRILDISKWLRDWQSAEKYVRQCISRDPKNYRWHLELGEILMQMGNFVRATECLRSGEKLLGPKATSYQPLLELKAFCDRITGLERLLPKAIGSDQSGFTAQDLADLAWLCRLPSKGLYSQSVRFYESAFVLDPKLALEESNRFDAACAAARQFRHRSGGGPVAARTRRSPWPSAPMVECRV